MLHSGTAVSKGASLSLRGLEKAYGGVAALNGIDLEVRAGEFMTFLGPSGSGKTSVLNTISGFLSPDKGTVEIGDKQVNRTPPHKRELGIVFQNYALFPHMTVYKNLEFPLKQRRIPKVERARLIAAALESVRLTGFEKRFPGQLSGGQQQRVAFARAIVYRPPVLLMDEPLGALDRKLRDWLQLEIKRIHRELGGTFIYVTHDQEEALTLSDRIAVFRDGNIEQIGTPEELYETPATLFVGSFVGESTIMHGSVESVGGAFVNISGEWGTVRALDSGADLSAGAALLVRPEKARLYRVEDAPPYSDHANQLSVQVSERVYLGGSIRFKIALRDGTDGLLRMQASDAPDLGPGDSAVMTWELEDGVVLPDDPNINRTTT